MVATRAAQRWNWLNVEKFQPVSQIKTLFLVPNAQMRTKFAKEITPVRSAIYRHSCVGMLGQLHNTSKHCCDPGQVEINILEIVLENTVLYAAENHIDNDECRNGNRL